MNENGNSDDEVLGVRKRSIPAGFVLKADQQDLDKLLICLEQLAGLGHTSIECSQKFAESIESKLSKSPTSPVSPTSPSRHPLAARIPTEDLQGTLSCIHLLIENKVDNVPCIKTALLEIRESLQRRKIPEVSSLCAAEVSPLCEGDSSLGGTSPPSPPVLNIIPTSPKRDMDFTVVDAGIPLPDVIQPVINFDTDAVEAPSNATYEWHDDEEKAFENEYEVEDCHLCHEMITTDEFEAHWANGVPPPKDHPLQNGKGVIETTHVHKGQDDLGQKMINQYTVVSELGKGSYGKVKLVVHVPTRKNFAIKILNKSLLRGVKMGMEKTALDDVLGEVAIMKRCHHKNVCQLREVIDDENGGKMYLIVDYYQKGPVFCLENNDDPDPLSEPQVKKYLIGVCQGLDYLHQMNIIHRDIKPANILVGSDDEATLTDFGISHSCEGNSEVADTKGTPAFLTPEQIKQEPIDGKMADIWAVGVTFYAMTYAQLPFKGMTYLELCKQVIEEDPEYPTTTSPALTMLIKGILKKNVDDRIGKNNGVRDILVHPYLLGERGAELQTHTEINVTDEDRSAAVVTGRNIQLRLGNTVGVMLQVKGAMKGFLGGPKKKKDNGLLNLDVNINNQGSGDPQLSASGGNLEIEYEDDDEDDEDDKPVVPSPSNASGRKSPSFLIRSSGSQIPLTPKRSFRTEEQAVMEDTSKDDVVKQIEKLLQEEEKELTLNCIKFDFIPEQVLLGKNLTSFTSHLNGLTCLPKDINQLENLVNLSIAHNRITYLPDSICDLKHLNRLDCNHNELCALPSNFGNLKQLKVINLDYNCFVEVPDAVCEIKGLDQCFIIQNVEISEFPEGITQWESCQFALTNTPRMLKLYQKMVAEGTFPVKNVTMVWNKLYPDPVEEHLYLGSLRTAQTEKILKELQINRIVTAGKGLLILDPLPAGMEQVTLNVDDNPDQKMTPFFNDITEYIEKQLEDEKSVLVHCFAGLSRSVAVVCAYLIKSKNMTFKDAITLVKKARPAANPNNGFRKQLIEYEHELHGTRLDPKDIENFSNGPSVEPEDI